MGLLDYLEPMEICSSLTLDVNIYQPLYLSLEKKEAVRIRVFI